MAAHVRTMDGGVGVGPNWLAMYLRINKIIDKGDKREDIPIAMLPPQLANFNLLLFRPSTPHSPCTDNNNMAEIKNKTCIT